MIFGLVSLYVLEPRSAANALSQEHRAGSGEGHPPPRLDAREECTAGPREDRQLQYSRLAPCAETVADFGEEHDFLGRSCGGRGCGFLLALHRVDALDH